ncbi:MAG: DUF3667 domain-containing protein [Ferruginibacter sp.]|nr:DUF3667 domain-containing protein [Ferruginibacter sp.]
MIDKPATCKNCGNRFEGKFCNQCGEKIYADHDKSIPHFFEDAFHFITHFEGTFFTTLRTVFTRPGRLSLDYCNGLRKKYFKPLPLFMLLVVLYLIFPIFSGLNMPFQFYLQGKVASRMITRQTGVNTDSLLTSINQQYPSVTNGERADRKAKFLYTDSVIKTIPALNKLGETFNKKSATISKILLLILLPLTAVVCWLLSLRKKRFFFDHLIVSTELNAFYLMIGFFLAPLLVTGIGVLTPATASRMSDSGVGIFIYGVLGIFSAIAMRRFYADKWWWSIFKAILLMGAHFIIVQVIYKFILFAVTFYLST